MSGNPTIADILSDEREMRLLENSSIAPSGDFSTAFSAWSILRSRCAEQMRSGKSSERRSAAETLLKMSGAMCAAKEITRKGCAS